MNLPNIMVMKTITLRALLIGDVYMAVEVKCVVKWILRMPLYLKFKNRFLINNIVESRYHELEILKLLIQVV